MRIRKDFSKGWRFRKGDPSGANEPAHDDSAWEQVNLPHSWNATDTFTPTRGYYRGPGWYRKTFDWPEGREESKVFLELDAAFARSTVWVNGGAAGSFMAGFTGVTIDISGAVRPGSNVVAIRVDNTHDPDVLPGLDKPDYNLYGGLYRKARLICTDRLYIPRDGVEVTTPSVSAEQASLRVRVTVRNDLDRAIPCLCAAELTDPSGEFLLEMRSTSFLEPGTESIIELPCPEISEPLLWSPETPNLYALSIYVEGDTPLRDDVEVAFGFRWFAFDADQGFFLNGKRLKLHGVNRHQDYPGLANAVPERLQVRDAELIKEMGGNFVRASHYPMHPAFLEACDRLGILFYAEIASWQFIGGEQFVRNAEQMMREMIARDKNHPCIILWGLLNEGRSRALFERLQAVAKEADPSRPTVYADNRPEEGKELGTVDVPDVVGINYKIPHIDDIRAALPELKLLSSEHTNWCVVRGNLAEEVEGARRIGHDIDAIEVRPFMAGAALWSMHDYGTDYAVSYPIQRSGLLDEYRLPKETYYLAASKWRLEPMVHLCGHWTWPQDAGRMRPVTVIHNCDSVELFVNGQSVGKSAEPWIADFEVAYEPGMLVAVGWKGPDTVEAQVGTAGAPAALRATSLTDVLVADGADATEITVRIVDEEGEVVPITCEVGFAIKGPGAIRGIAGNPWTRVVDGVGRIIVQATNEEGTIQVTAQYPNVTSSEVSLRSMRPEEARN